MEWYAIFVLTGQEEHIAQYLTVLKSNQLKNIEFDLLIPKRRIYERKQGINHEKIKPMFPGYILLRTANIQEFYQNIRYLPIMIRILRSDNMFGKIQQKEMLYILDLVDRDGIIGISDAFIVDSTVKIANGPLYGKEGIIKKVNRRKGRAKVELELFNRTCLIDLGINVLKII